MSNSKLYVKVVSYSNYDCTILINNIKYVYRNYNIPGYKLKYIFEKIAKYSPGKALQWIKENAEVIDKYE